MYGGSTTFGLGQRDDHTIASELARRAWASGIALDIDNRGVVGDTHWEEAERLAWDVATLGPPDLVVFLDGINEMQASTRLKGETRQPVGLVKEDFWANYLATAQGMGMDGRWAPTPASEGGPPGASVPATIPLAAESAEDLGRLIARRFELARHISSDVGRANDVPIVWFWQPSIDSRPPMSGEPVADGREWASQRYRAAADAIGTDVHDISGALDAVDEPLYWDSYHTNEKGAQLTAEAMFDDLRRQLATIIAAAPA
jgi:lysophospholipase L1-like esterase